MNIDLKNIFGDLTSLEPKFTSTILKAFKENSSDQLDYLKFKQAILSLESLNLDETTRIQSALTTMQAMGVKKQDLINSVKQYDAILGREQSEFVAALNKQIKIKIDGEQDRLAKYQKEIENIAKKIEELKAKSQQYQEAIDQSDSKISEARSKIQATNDQFVKTYDYFKGLIASDLAAIKNQ